MGGAYWSLTILSMIILGLPTALLHEPEDGVVEGSAIRAGMIIGCSGLVLFYVAFLSTIKKEFVCILLNIRTSFALMHQRFLTHELDK